MKNIIPLYMKADAYIIRRLNDAYLWALDWSGLYVGTIIFLIGIIQAMYFFGEGSYWIAALMLLCGIINGGMRYALQGASIKAFNDMAIMFEGILARHVFIILGIFTITPDFFLRPTILAALSDTVTVLMWYMFCIKIRDRQKKKLEFKVPRLAYGTNT